MKSKRSPSFVRSLLFTIVPLLLLLLPLTNSEISAAIKITPPAVTPPTPTANTTCARAYSLIQISTNDFNWLLIELQLVSRSEQKQGEQEHYISYEEFSKVHLKIGKVIQAESVPGMKKVFKVRIDIGADQRDLVVGAAPFYKPEEVVGKVVVVCTNLEPKKIGGIVSNGMLLAADGPEGRPIFLTVAEEDDVGIGAVIK